MRQTAQAMERSWSWGWLAELIWSPQQLFEHLRERWVWIPAYLTTATFIAIGSTLAYSAMQEATSAALRGQDTPQDISQLVLLANQIGYFLSPVLSPFVTPVLFAYFLLFLSMFLAVRVKFGKLFSLSMWSFVPFVGVRYLAQGLVVLLSGHTSIFNVELSAAAFLPWGSSPLLRILAAQVDPFYLWSLFLLATGFSTLLRQPLKTGVICSAVAVAIRVVLTLSVA